MLGRTTRGRQKAEGDDGISCRIVMVREWGESGWRESGRGRIVMQDVLELQVL